MRCSVPGRCTSERRLRRAPGLGCDPDPIVTGPRLSNHPEAILSTTRRSILLPSLAGALALAGIALAAFVLGDHLTVFEGNHAEGLFCSGAGHFDCNPVAAHPASWMFG